MNSLLSSYIRILFIFIFIFINTPVPWSLPTHLIYIRYLLVRVSYVFWSGRSQPYHPRKTLSHSFNSMYCTYSKIAAGSWAGGQAHSTQWGRHEEFRAHKKTIPSMMMQNLLYIPITQLSRGQAYSGLPSLVCIVLLSPYTTRVHHLPSEPWKSIQIVASPTEPKIQGVPIHAVQSPLRIDLQLRSTEPI